MGINKTSYRGGMQGIENLRIGSGLRGRGAMRPTGDQPLDRHPESIGFIDVFAHTR